MAIALLVGDDFEADHPVSGMPPDAGDPGDTARFNAAPRMRGPVPHTPSTAIFAKSCHTWQGQGNATELPTVNVTVLSVVRWLRAVWRWLSEASMLWFALAGSALVPVVTILSIGPTEQGLRVAGLLMQLLGLATVTWGIRQTRLIFKRPGLAEIARSWIERFPAIQPDIVVTAATESAGGSARARGYVWGNPPENASSDQRLAVVAANLEKLRSRVDETENALDTEIRERVGSVQDARAAREAEDQQIRTFFEGVTAGGLNLSLVGVVWLVLGIVAASLPGEIADFLK